MEKRSCGECTACCKTHFVEEIKKIRGDWCKHCDIGKGCRIYQNRPESCSNYSCDWLHNPKIEERFRPDKIKIVAETKIQEGLGLCLWLWELEPGVLLSEFSMKWTFRNVLSGNPVFHVSLTDNNRVYFPERIDDSKHRFYMGESFENGVKFKNISFGQVLSEWKALGLVL